MNHDIRIQAWGRYAVATCETCPTATPSDRAILRANTADGFSYAALVAAIEKHTGEGAFRATSAEPESDLVAFGEPDEFPPGYHPRTGQKLPENLDPSARPGGGDPLADYLHQKGEF